MPHPNLKFKIPNFKLISGFTLIEILVVIGIIGILAGTTTVSYTRSQLKTRDSQRKNDLQTIKSALDLYFQQNHQYPQSCLGNPDQSCHSTDPQPWIPELSGVISRIPTDPTQTSHNFFQNMLAKLQQFNFIKAVYAVGGGCGSQAAALATVTGGAITDVTPFCVGSGYSANAYVIINSCPSPPTRQASITGLLSSGTISSYQIADGGAGYSCTPTLNVEPPPGGGSPPATPPATPPSTPGPTPYATPAPATGCNGASTVDYYYCYTVNTSLNGYKLWAHLENSSDNQVSSNPDASCYDATPPTPKLNFCIETD